MVDAGAEPPRVANWVHNNRSLASVRLLGESLRTLRIICGGKLALITADEEAFARAEAGPEDTEETVNVPRSITGVEAVAYFKQWEAGVVRISLRSRGAVDVRAVAASFGGGGHTNAAGCTIEGELAEIEEMVASAMAKAIGGSV
jgi:phosphoesterase RecJ-like protein